MFSNLKSTVKVYSVTLVTTVLLMLVVGLYIFQVIPANKQKLDKGYYRNLYQLREKFDKINEDLSKQVAIDKDTTQCYLAANDIISIKIIKDGVQITKTQVESKTSKTFSFEDYYQALFNNTDFTVAICNPADSNRVSYSKGEPEPNDKIIPDGKQQDYYTIPDSLLDTRYYFYFFRPKYSHDKIAISIGVNRETFEKRAKDFDASQTLFAVLAMLLLFLVAPLLKSVSGSRYEQLTAFDVVSSTSAIGLISMLGLIFLLSYVSFCALCERQQSKLIMVAGCFKNNIQTELTAYTNALRSADDTIAFKFVECDSPSIDILKQYETFFRDNFVFKGKQVTGFFRLNDKGNLVQDEYPGNGNSSNCRTNFSGREYFRAHTDSTDTIKIYFEPLISWRTNSFRVTVSKRYARLLDSADCKRPVVSALSFLPVFNRYYALPPDYGFAVIDRSGRVQMHSDSTKNLAENFFEELDNPLWIKEAIVFDTALVHPQYYRGQKMLMCLMPISVPDNAHQFYLVMFKNIAFTDGLLLTAVINAFIISLIYVLIIIALAYFFSVVYFSGHNEKFSGFHFTWLFPDNRNSGKYNKLILVNILSILLIVIAALCADYSTTLFIAFNIGILTVFLHFVFTVKKQPWTRKQKISFGLVILINSCLLILISPDYFLLKIFLEMLVYLVYFKWIMPCKSEMDVAEPAQKPAAETESITTPSSSSETKPIAISKRKPEPITCERKFSFFLTSSIGLHYIFIPMLIFVCIIFCECDRAGFLTEAGLQQQLNAIPRDVKDAVEKKDFLTLNLAKDFSSGDIIYDENNPFDKLISQLPYGRPSDYYLQNLNLLRADIKPIGGDTKDNPLGHRVGELITGKKILQLSFFFLFHFFIAFTLVCIYANRFFFFDLRAVSKTLLKKEPAYKIKGTLEAELTPPFNSKISECFLNAENINGSKKEMAALFNFEGAHTDYPARLAIANQLNKEANITLFTDHWNKRSKQQQFVLFDLAKDNFINYRNKDILIQLMQEGFVVSDPASGRIRLISYAFRQFILDWVEENPAYFASEKEEESKSAWAKWQLPVIIVAGTILMFLFYVNNNEYNTILSFTTGIGGAVGLVLKFLTTYKNTATQIGK